MFIFRHHIAAARPSTDTRGQPFSRFDKHCNFSYFRHVQASIGARHHKKRKKATRHGLSFRIMVDISRHIELLGPSGRTLSISERSGLQVTSIIEKRPHLVDEHRRAKIYPKPKLDNNSVLNLYGNLLLGGGGVVERYDSAGLCAHVKGAQVTS